MQFNLTIRAYGIGCNLRMLAIRSLMNLPTGIGFYDWSFSAMWVFFFCAICINYGWFDPQLY